MKARAFLHIAGAVTIATAASADEQDDAPSCETSSECGSLKCIHGRCSDPATFGQVVAHPPTPGWAALFNEGHGYSMTILAADIAAACVVPALAVLAFTGVNGSINGVFAIAAIFPTTLTGPIIHIIHGRAIPAFISFFGWASVVPTTIGMNAVGQLLACCNTNGGPTGAATGMLEFGIAATAGAALMTSLDVFMARTVRRPDTPIVPAITPLRSGALFTVGGGW